MTDEGGKSKRLFASLASQGLEERARELERRNSAMQNEEAAQVYLERQQREDREPLPPRRWIENEYFCGHFSHDVFDVLKEKFCQIYEQGTFEVLMGGAIGWGKTSFVLLLHTYSLYLLSCYGVPQRAFRSMMESAQILYLNLNRTMAKAKNSYYMDLYRLVHSIPYFRQDFPPQKGVVNELRFPQKRIMCTFAGATKTAAESEHLIFCVLDEANLYDVVEKSKRAVGKGEKYDEAEVVHTSALRRMQTRFMLPDGKMPTPCKLVSLCKETYPKSFIRRRMKEARDNGHDRPDAHGRVRTAIMEFAEWETKPEETYEKEYFWIQTGTRTESPRIIEDEQEAVRETQRQEKKRLEGVEEDELCEVIQVPRAGGEYVLSAQSDLVDFIRDVCGRATEALNMFFPKREIIFKAIRRPGDDRWPAEVCEHPFTSEETTFFDGVFLRKECLAKLDGKNHVWRPIVNPTAKRFVHVDIGLTEDAAGIAMGYISGWVDVVRRGADVKPEMLSLPVIWYDLVMRVVPPPDDEIPYAGIRGLIYSLRGLGFRIAKVTYDSYQRSWVQELKTRKFKCEILSVDTSMDPYDELKAAFREGRVSRYEFPLVEDELTALEKGFTGRVRDGRPVAMVDHPKDGSKDVSDAMAGVAWGVMEHSRHGVVESGVAVQTSVEKRGAGEKDVEKRTLFKNGNWEKLYDVMKREEED